MLRASIRPSRGRVVRVVTWGCSQVMTLRIHEIFYVFTTVLMINSSEETVYLKYLQHHAGHMKHHIAYSRRQHNSFFTFQLILIDIIQVSYVSEFPNSFELLHLY